MQDRNPSSVPAMLEEDLPPARILLVDDQPANLTVLQAVLEPLGVPLATARNGVETLRHLLRDEFAVILLDVQMPTMNGFEVAALIKERERSRATPIVFLTAASHEPDFLTQAYAAGGVDYLIKPYNPDILRAKVSVFVALYRQRELIRRQDQLLRERELAEAHARDLAEAAQKQRQFLREVLFSLTEGRLRLCDSPQELPKRLPPLLDAPAVTLTRPSLRHLRRQVTAATAAAQWSPERCYDFESAVGEAAMNAVVHGKDGQGTVRADPATGQVQVWIEDRGSGITQDALHRATLERGYTTAGTLGHGFWMMLKMADRVFLLTGADGTTVVLEQGRAAALPAWLQSFEPPPTHSVPDPPVTD